MALNETQLDIMLSGLITGFQATLENGIIFLLYPCIGIVTCLFGSVLHRATINMPVDSRIALHINVIYLTRIVVIMA